MKGTRLRHQRKDEVSALHLSVSRGRNEVCELGPVAVTPAGGIRAAAPVLVLLRGPSSAAPRGCVQGVLEAPGGHCQAPNLSEMKAMWQTAQAGLPRLCVGCFFCLLG